MNNETNYNKKTAASRCLFFMVFYRSTASKGLFVQLTINGESAKRPLIEVSH